MAERDLTLQEKKQRRDGAIVDFSRGLINRREFMRRMTAVGVSAAFAAKVGDAVAGPKPAAKSERWRKQADVTVTFIKGEHHPDDTKFWEALKTNFESSHPGIKLNPTFFKWATMDAELTAGYASDAPPDSIYLVDLVLAKFGKAGQVADVSAWTNDAAYATEKAGIAPFTWDVTAMDGKQLGVGALGAVFNIYYNLDLFAAAGITAFPQTRQELIDAAKALTKDGVWGIQFRDKFPDYAHWDWLPYVHNDSGDVLSADLTTQGLDPAAGAGTQFLADLKLEHQVSPEAGAYDWISGNRPLWEAGRVAILHDEAPQAVVWEGANLPFKFDLALAPKTDAAGTKQTAMGNFGYATISEKSPNKEAAWEFVKWWTSAEVINPYAAQIGLQGVRVDSVPPYESPALQKVQSEFVPNVQGVQIHENYYQMLTELWPEIEKAYRGEQTGAEAVAKAGEVVNRLNAPA